MMGGEGHPADTNLDEIRLSAVSEAMNQMMGSATTSLSSMFNKRIDIGPPEVNLVDLGFSGSGHCQQIIWKWCISNLKWKSKILINSEIMQVLPIESVRNMIEILMGGTVETSMDEIMEKPPEPPTRPETNYVEQPAPASAAY